MSKITEWLTALFFLSLPFERLLTLEVAGYTLKISYALAVILIIYFFYSKLRDKNCHSCPASQCGINSGRNPGNVASAVDIGPLDPRLHGDDTKKSGDDTKKSGDDTKKSGDDTKKSGDDTEKNTTTSQESRPLLCQGYGGQAIYEVGLRIAREEIFLLLFVLLSYLTTLWSIDPKRTLIISSVFFLMALVFMVVRRLINEDNREKFENIIIWLGVGTSIFALWQYLAGSIPSLNFLSFLRPQYLSQVFGFPRVQSTFLEPLYFANFLLIPLFLVIKRLTGTRPVSGGILTSPRKLSGLPQDATQKISHLEESSTRDHNIDKWDYFKLGLMGVALFLTLSRGAIFAFIFGLVVLGILLAIGFKKYLKVYLTAIITLLISVIIGSALIFAVAGSSGLKVYFGHASVDDIKTGESVIDRTSTLKVAWQSFLDKPFGIGAGAFGSLPAYKNDISGQGYQTVNDLYLEVAAEEGFLGLTLLLSFFLLVFFQLVREVRRHKTDLWFEESATRTILKTSHSKIRSKNKQISAVFYLVIFLALFAQYLTFSTLYIIYIWLFLSLSWPGEQAGKQVSS